MRVCLQAGHGSSFPPYYPNGGGAPGESIWTTDLAKRIAARLSTRGVEVVLVGHWYDTARGLKLLPPPEAEQDAHLFVALHYDGSLDPNATGCCAGRATLDPMGAAADAFLRLWTTSYPAALGISLKQERVGPNITDYYAFRDTTENTPGALLEHGYGNCADHATLFDRIEEVADVDTSAILAYLESLRHPVWSNTEAPLTQAFGVNAASYAQFGLAGHNGLDFGMPVGTPLHAPEAGTVSESYYDTTGYGHTVYVAADSGNGWRLGHLDARAVAGGQRVDALAPLGTSGNTGNSTGPHLHLGLRPPQPDYGNGFNGYIDPTDTLAALRTPAPPEPPPTEPEDSEVIAALVAQVEEISADRDLYIAALQEANAIKQQFEALLREPLYHRRVSASGKSVRYVVISESEIQAAIAAGRQA